MQGPYAAKLAALLGEVARQGRSGLLLLAAEKGEAGGALAFSRGALAGCRHVPVSAGGADAPPADTASLRSAVGQAARAAGASGALPRFRPIGPGEADPGAGPRVTAPLTAADLAVDACRLIDDAAWLRDEVRARLGERPAVSAAPPAAAPRLALGAGEGYLLSRADGTLTLQQILDTAPFDELETLRALFSLGAVGMLAEASTPKASAAAMAGGARAARSAPAGGQLSDLDTFLKKTAAPAGGGGAGGGPAAPRALPAGQQKEREELLAKCGAIGGQDLYSVLGVEQGVDESAIRHAYYRLARLYHPDRLLKPHLEDIHRSLEGMFAAITEAYNTLSDPAARGEYDRQMCERAAGRKKDPAQDVHAAARESYMRGRKEMEAGRTFEAIRLFETAVERDPTRAEYFHHLGVCQGQNPRWRKKAEENLLKAIALNPGAAQSYLELARIYRKGGLERRGQEMYEQALKWDPACEEALEALGRRKDPGAGILRLFKKD